MQFFKATTGMYQASRVQFVDDTDGNFPVVSSRLEN